MSAIDEAYYQRMLKDRGLDQCIACDRRHGVVCLENHGWQCGIGECPKKQNTDSANENK